MAGNGKVFVSHTPEDATLCMPLFAALDAWEVDYLSGSATLSAGRQLSDTLQQASAERDIFIRVCTPATQQSIAMGLQTSAFRGLQAADRQRGHGDRRSLINLILAPGYVREPFDNATLFIDATNRPRAAWMGDLSRALGLSRNRGRLSRRALLGLGAAAITTIAASQRSRLLPAGLPRPVRAHRQPAWPYPLARPVEPETPSRAGFRRRRRLCRL